VYNMNLIIVFIRRGLRFQGHKFAKSRAPPTPYQIIKKASFTNASDASGASLGPMLLPATGPIMSHNKSFSSPHTASHKLLKGKSMFSLSAERSLRLQRWGNWIAYEDQVAKTVYWYNPNTLLGQWEKPEEVNNLQQMMGNPGAHSASSRVRVCVVVCCRCVALCFWICLTGAYTAICKQDVDEAQESRRLDTICDRVRPDILL
jgi:hypothetical protein